MSGSVRRRVGTARRTRRPVVRGGIEVAGWSHEIVFSAAHRTSGRAVSGFIHIASRSDFGNPQAVGSLPIAVSDVYARRLVWLNVVRAARFSRD